MMPVLGVFAGFTGWWLMLSAEIGLLRWRLTASWLSWINRISGAAIVGFSVVTLLSVGSLRR